MRFDPKVKWGLELAARRQHRTASSYIEWAVSRSLRDVADPEAEGQNIEDLLNLLWHPQPPDRLLNLADHRPALLTFEEELIMSAIAETDFFWVDASRRGKERNNGKVRGCWDQLLRVASGELEAKDLIDPDDDQNTPKEN